MRTFCEKNSRLWKEVTYPSHLSKHFRTCQLTKWICICIKATSISGNFCLWKLALAIQMDDFECFRLALPIVWHLKTRKNCYGHCAHSSSCYVYSVQKFIFRLGSQLGYAFPAIRYRKYHIWQRALLFSVNILLTYYMYPWTISGLTKVTPVRWFWVRYVQFRSSISPCKITGKCKSTSSQQ